MPEEAQKLSASILKRILYDEWLPKIADFRQYSGYKPSVNATVRYDFVDRAFQFDLTLN